MSIKAIVFDLDGVLLDAKHWHFLAFQSALQEQGVALTESGHESKFCGLPTKTKLDTYVASGELTSAQAKTVYSRKQEITREYLEKVGVDKGLQHSLRQLKELNLKLAVASNAIASTVDEALKRLGLMDMLEFAFSNEDVSSPKPNPEIYLKSFERLEVKAEEVLILEDSPFGRAAAQASGAHLMEIEKPSEVCFSSIYRKLKEIAENEQNQLYYSDGGRR